MARFPYKKTYLSSQKPKKEFVRSTPPKLNLVRISINKTFLERFSWIMEAWFHFCIQNLGYYLGQLLIKNLFLDEMSFTAAYLLHLSRLKRRLFLDQQPTQDSGFHLDTAEK